MIEQIQTYYKQFNKNKKLKKQKLAELKEIYSIKFLKLDQEYREKKKEIQDSLISTYEQVGVKLGLSKQYIGKLIKQGKIRK